MKPFVTRHFDPLSRALHWLTAIAVLAAFVLGPEHFVRMVRDGGDPATHWDVVVHETLGVTVFALTLLRLLWVAMRPAAPQFPMPAWMAWAAKCTHLVLWALLLLVPLTAVRFLGVRSFPLTLLGGFRLDAMPFIANLPIASLASWGKVHSFLGDAILAVAGVHAAAAIYHHVALKDGVLQSMLPPGRKP